MSEKKVRHSGTDGKKEVHLPRLFRTHRKEDLIVIHEWHVCVGEVIQPDALLLTVDTLQAFVLCFPTKKAQDFSSGMQPFR